MTPSASPSSHLETIDYKPPAKPTSPSSLTTETSAALSGVSSSGEEKKTADCDTHDDDDHHDDDHDQVDLYTAEAEEWDEGGNSHCGYSEVIHSTLMTVGETVHNVIGEPSPHVEKELKAVGNWFQEASYAARDLFRGSDGHEGMESNGMSEDALDAVKTMFRVGSNDENNQNKTSAGVDGNGDENQDPASAGGQNTSS